MRGDDRQQGAMFSYLSPEHRVPADHPLRPIRQMVEEVLQELSPRFDRMYAQMGRPSIAAKVPRPAYSVLENRGLKASGLNTFRPWQDGLRTYLGITGEGGNGEPRHSFLEDHGR